ncbi:MAG TPA: translation initiation factor IF-2 associated domain-containing protein, partial [Afifellaceae bacterium]|nr:translation initiation factor IF-2 associated domain-containing protein [Afifellaceae bacterium]
MEAGEVKQTFSHGRTNKVVVEVKRRKLVGKPGAAVEAPAETPPAPPPAPPPPPPPAPPVARKRSPLADAETRQEM